MIRRLGAIAGATPVGRALLFALRLRDRPSLALLGLVLAYALLALTEPFSRTMQRSLIATTHFRPKTLASWVVLQPLPKMYVHENRVWVEHVAPAGGSLTPFNRARFDRGAFYVNHYPARIARFDGHRRDVFVRQPDARFLVLRTRYRDTTVTTDLAARAHDGRLWLSPAEATP